MQLPDIDDGIRQLGAMQESLDDYMLSQETFWPLGSTRYPKLSLGQLLLSLDLVGVQENAMTAAQAGRYRQIADFWLYLKETRPANLSKKALAESKQRLNLWRAFLSELSKESAASLSYASEVVQRALPARLEVELQPGAEWDGIRKQMAQLDQQLRPRFRAGDFVWPGLLQPRYDQQAYWYLYGTPA